MIRVNLLPVKRKKKAKPVPMFLIVMVLLTLISSLGAAYYFYYLNSRISSLTKQNQDNAAQITELSNKIKEVENFQTQRKTLEDRKNIIEKLRKNQSIPAKILSEMSSVLPAGVWITSMTVTGENISIAGLGFTNEDVVNYIDNLKKSPLLADVYLQGSTKSGSGSVITYTFTVKCKLKA